MSAVPTAHDINVKPRTGDVLIEENLDFRGLLLSESIQQGLEKGGFQRPSPIQLKAIPLGRCGLDLIVQAKSGTGKTCVFSVIALEGVILDSLATQVLVLAPTREIAVQICEVINSIGSCMTGLRCLTFIGGTPLSEDRQKLARCHIAVGTPGRIKQLIEENILPTSNIRLFVLDEADKLLEDNFQEQINWIFSSLPDNKQMLALSATYPEVLAQHLTAYMRNPTFLRLNVTDPALLGIRQYYRQVEFHPLANKLFDRKTDALLELLSTVEFHQCLVFSNFQMRAESLSEVLNFRGWPATYISGSREQQDRMAAMASLKQMTCRVLISTDLTSRGIDAENVNLIINLDLPPNHETYLHRIGRAGRFGTYGAGVSFVADGKEMEELKRLEKACNTNVKPLPDPIPSDLARSSGFVSLEHLVTTETIVTQKEGVEIKSSKVPMPQLIKKDPKPSGTGSPGKPIVKSADNGELQSKSDDKKSNGNDNTQSKAEPQQLNGSNEKVGDESEKAKETNETPTVPASTDISLPTTDAVQTSAKPKWKTNNVWTNLSFSYGAECQQMDDQRKMGKLTHAGPGDQRRNEGPKKDATQSPRKGVTIGADKENGFRNGVENPIAAVKGSGGDKSAQKSGKEPTLSMPSLKDIRGSPGQLRPFSHIMEDFANFTVKGENIPKTKEDDQKETSKGFTLSMQYLENVSKLLKELSEKEQTITALQKTPQPETPTTHQVEHCKKVQSEEPVQVQSAKTVNVQSEPQVAACKTEPKYEPKPSCQTEKVSCKKQTPKKSEVEKVSAKKEAPNKPDVEKVSPEKPDNMAGAHKGTTQKSWSRGGTNRSKKTQVTLTVGPTLERMMTNYETLNESNKDKGPGDHQTCTASAEAANPNKPKPYKHKKRVDPYGAWEPYVAPEPSAPVEAHYISPEVTDDEDSEGTSESDWESSSISCDEEDVYDGAGAGRNRRRSSAKPTQMGYEYTPSPGFSSPGDYLAYQNAWLAQQAVFHTSFCYQQYVMHLQYAEYYRQQLKAQQHAAGHMDTLYASHKKYIRKMAKWMAKHNPDE